MKTTALSSQMPLTVKGPVMKYIMKCVALQQLFIMQSFAGTRIMKRRSHSGQEGHLTLNISTKDESWIHLADAFAVCVLRIAALCEFSMPAFGLKGLEHISGKSKWLGV